VTIQRARSQPTCPYALKRRTSGGVPQSTTLIVPGSRNNRRASPVSEPPPRSEETVAEGKQVYRLLQCWKCHGKAGRRAFGPGPEGRLGESGEDRELYRTLHSGMNGSPMPSFTVSFVFARETDELSEYLGRQPDSASLAQELAARRTWALIYYLRLLFGSSPWHRRVI